MKGFIEVNYFLGEGEFNENNVCQTGLIKVSDIKSLVKFKFEKRVLNIYGFYDNPECYIETSIVIYPQESYESIKELIKESL